MVSKKKNLLFVLGWDRKYDPRDHRLASLGNPRDTQVVSV